MAKAVNDAADPDVRRNDKGEIISWSSTNDNGRLLRMLVENGNIKPGMTAGAARRDKYPMFKDYSYNCFQSALNNVRKSLGTEVEAREQQTGRGGRSGRIQSYSNLNGCDDDDDDFDDDTYKMSKMSVNDHDDDYSYDTRTQQGAKSVSFDHPYSSGRSIKSTASRIHGVVSSSSGGGHRMSHSGGTPPRSPAKPFKARPVSCSLPYIIDYWHDLRPHQERASIQVHMLSMSKDNMLNVSYRVSTARNEFVILIPVSEYFGQPDTAFNYYVLREKKPEDHSTHIHSLQYHPKSNARRLHLAELRSKSPNVNTIMEFRIPLRRQYSLDFASSINDDPYFFGSKFVEYPDGSFHLHAELVADTVEGANNPLNRNSAAMFLNNNNIPGSVSVPSGGGDEDDYSYMDVTVQSNAGGSKAGSRSGSVGAASPSTIDQFAQGTTPFISPSGVILTPVVTKNHPLSLNPTTDDATAYSGGASNQDARSVKSRITVGTTGTTSKAKRKLRASPQKATTRSTAIKVTTVTNEKAD